MSGGAKEPTKVFISYSWDSAEHKARVKQLADTLRNPLGIETDIDEYVRAVPPYTPPQGWDIWMQRRIDWAEFVLIVCTETYKQRFEGDGKPGEGRGSTWEGTIIRQSLYQDQLNNTKFIPVVFSHSDLANIPRIIKNNDRYIIEDSASLENLVRRLRKEPAAAMPKIADLPNQINFALLAQDLAVTSPKESPIQPPIASPPVEQSTGDPPELPTVKVGSPSEEEIKLSSSGTQTIALEGNYARLESLLKARKWKEADGETARRICEVMGRQKEGWLREEDIEQFPCTDLHIIDQFWMKHSDHKFGFSIQETVWQQCGNPT